MILKIAGPLNKEAGILGMGSHVSNSLAKIPKLRKATMAPALGGGALKSTGLKSFSPKIKNGIPKPPNPLVASKRAISATKF